MMVSNVQLIHMHVPNCTETSQTYIYQYIATVIESSKSHDTGGGPNDGTCNLTKWKPRSSVQF